MDDSRLNQRVARPDHAADRAFDADGGGQRAARVEARQIGRSRAGDGEILVVPPRYAVLGKHHGGLRVEQGADGASERRQAVRLQGGDDNILSAQLGWSVARRDPCLELPLTTAQP